MRSGAIACSILITATAASAAQPLQAVNPEVQRGVFAVGSRVSDQPALRKDAEAHAPAPGFALGAALAAWRNAGAGLGYDLGHPAGDGGEAGILAGDCFDEKTAFGRLQAAAEKLGFSPQAAVAAAGLAGDVTVAWSARRLGPPAECR